VLVWLNGRLRPASRARVSALDRGLLHGDGVYDTWRTYGGEPFMVAAHVRRLAAAARALGLPAPGPPAAWEWRTRRLVERNGLRDAAVRLTLTRGAAGEALAPERAAPPTVLLTARRLPADLARRQTRGVAAVLLPFPRDAAPPWGGLKLIGQASAVAGRIASARRRVLEGLYVTAAGEVTEATGANLFLVERGRLVTPPCEAGILPGVTRALVVALARRADLAVREERVPIARLLRAREIFLTASTVELLPVVRLERRPVGGGRPGEVTRRLQADYAACVVAALRRARPAARVAGSRQTC
jgi:branched-subunit amino acid aminotransferase/4-amino-4-deoxychorismate lyase